MKNCKSLIFNNLSANTKPDTPSATPVTINASAQIMPMIEPINTQPFNRLS